MPKYLATKPVIVKNTTELGDISKSYASLTQLSNGEMGLGIEGYVLTNDKSLDYGGDIVKRFKDKILIQKNIHMSMSTLEKILRKLYELHS